MTWRQRGVTLIELLITISIVVVMLTLAVPGFQDFMTSNRQSGATADFMGAINFARSEAVTRGTPVTLCPTTNGTACAATTAWASGRLVFADTDGDGVLDSGETLLRRYPTLAGNNTANGTMQRITFLANGTTANIGTIAICHGSDETKAQALILTRASARISVGDSEINTCETP